MGRFVRSRASRSEIEAEIERQIRQQDPEVPDDVIAEIVSDIASDVVKEQHRNSVTGRLLRLILPALMLGALASILSTILVRGLLEPSIEKAPIQADILRAIRNGADIDALKIVYSTRARPVDGFAKVLRRQDFYKSSEAHLHSVLNDLKANSLTQEKQLSDEERLLLVKLNLLIAEYTKVNPFEGLEENQKRDLSNIARKLTPEQYAQVSDDIASIVVELKQKNSLVTKYLNSSDISLWLSIVALALTVGVTFWQFRPKARKTQKELIQEALNEFNSKRAADRPAAG